jgi:SAM-dependent methyltransferase/uncharacterized protein YbaR (Trm112 family)
MDSSSFDRNKIYEKLEYKPKPPDYEGRIPWTVQQQIAATNGVHFVSAVGHLKEYPIPPIPIGPAKTRDLFLDIGNGWGRWMVAAARKGYLPVGIDLRLEFCETSRIVLKDNGFHGYTVVADLRKLPFLDGIFDVIWSFSVIQHTHIERLMGCIEGMARILKKDGYCFLEFPNKNGLYNRFGPARKYAGSARDYNSWDVRYYTPSEYRDMFSRYFDQFDYFNHSMLGIGVLPGDFKYARGLSNKTGILLSRVLSSIADIITPLKKFSDSIYIRCEKKGEATGGLMESIRKFLQSDQVDPWNNLNICHLLCCPATGGTVFLSPDGNEIISEKARLAYPLKRGIPIMVAGEARSL